MIGYKNNNKKAFQNTLLFSHLKLHYNLGDFEQYKTLPRFYTQEPEHSFLEIDPSFWTSVTHISHQRIFSRYP